MRLCAFAVYRLVHANATQAGYRWKRLGSWDTFAEAEHAAIFWAAARRGRPKDGRFTLYEIRLGKLVVGCWSNKELAHLASGSTNEPAMGVMVKR